MDEYYQKIRKRSVTSIILGVALMLGGAYFLYTFLLIPGISAKDSIFYAAFGGALVGFGLFVLISSLRGVSGLKKKIAEMGINDSLLAQDLAGGLSYKDCNIGTKYALQCKGRLDIIRLYDALVVYMDISSTTSKGYTTYSYYIRVVERSGEGKYLTAGSEEEMKDIFTQLTRMRPYVITRMDCVMQELRKKNLPELIRLVDERRMEYESGNIESGIN